MGWLDYVILFLVAVAVVGVLVWQYRRKKAGKGGCCGSCSGCAGCGSHMDGCPSTDVKVKKQR